VSRAAPLPLPGVDPDGIDWRRAGPRLWVYRRGGERAEVRGPLSLGRGRAFRSRIRRGGVRRLRQPVWQWAAFLRAAELYGGGGTRGRLHRARAAAEAEIARARLQSERDPFRRR
jgi:hypothetical protein